MVIKYKNIAVFYIWYNIIFKAHQYFMCHKESVIVRNTDLYMLLNFTDVKMCKRYILGLID